MNWIKGGIAAFAALLVCGLAAGCEAAAVPTNVPGNIVAIKATPMGAALAKYGYTPVANIYDNKTSKLIGYAYVDCRGVNNISTCSSNLNNEGTLSRPNVLVENGVVTTLEGPHDNRFDDRSYWVTVPDAYQHFQALSSAQQLKLLGIMPSVAKALGSPVDSTYTVVMTPIGEVTAVLSRS
jgi:hypothetical protein